MNIYLIEPDQIDLWIVKKLLAFADATLSIAVCQSPVAALSELTNKNEQPDAIITDWYMAEMDTEDWLTYYTHQVKEVAPVFILSASIHPQDRQRAMKFEVVKGFFMKPFAITDIQHMLYTSAHRKSKKQTAVPANHYNFH